MRGEKQRKAVFINTTHNMIVASRKRQVTHSLFVCEEKVKVSLAKSSLFSNWSSFALTQKLFSERSSGPI